MLKKSFIKGKQIDYNNLNNKKFRSKSVLDEFANLEEENESLKEMISYLSENYDTFPSVNKSAGVLGKLKNILIGVLYNYTIGQRHFNEQVKNSLFLFEKKVEELEKRTESLYHLSQKGKKIKKTKKRS